jgi:hypothetical protein
MRIQLILLAVFLLAIGQSTFAQIHVKSNGVGIGTNAPAEKLHVAGKTLIVMLTRTGRIMYSIPLISYFPCMM